MIKCNGFFVDFCVCVFLLLLFFVFFCGERGAPYEIIAPEPTIYTMYHPG